MATTLVLMGVVAVLLHLLIVWLGLPDLVALLVYAAPIAIYIAYCTQDSMDQIIGSAIRTYCSFAAVVVAAAGLVYLIG